MLKNYGKTRKSGIFVGVRTPLAGGPTNSMNRKRAWGATFFETPPLPF